MIIDFGYIYAASNESFSEGILKIGYTGGGVAERLDQLYTTSVPTPFKEEFSMFVPFPDKIEKKLHERLNKCRINGSREYFRCTLDDVYNNLDILEEFWGYMLGNLQHFFYAGAMYLSEETTKKCFISRLLKDKSIEEQIEENESFYVKNGVLYNSPIVVEIGDLEDVFNVIEEMKYDIKHEE